ncbi:hypothetical protein PP935_gp161 [Rhizobium phage RHph_N34]|uniref:Uncharacterized protein n=1 Tax=Rhizobium phage RHph_N34 TaxID=2509586 RepID=A0A7S5REA7_9CAUD|nr:hypothetical protein PP935_gp161 [Rhizobium phage RHph_N34]QIG73936.1 hypothetical protein EVC06_161 [Rhizobium phage RHph_N34]
MLVNSSFISRRLQQLEPVGARLIVSGYHCGNFIGKFEVSNVRLADEVYTRVRNLNFDKMWHFEGVLDTQGAANRTAELFDEWLQRR